MLKKILKQLSRTDSKNKFKGFTLAEILITLTIIGVVAAITVPTLTKKTGNQESVSRLLKAYSDLSQAVDMIIIEDGPTQTWMTNTTTATEVLYNKLRAKLRSTKSCGASKSSGCFAEGNYIKLDGNTTWYNIESGISDERYKKFILSNGVSILIDGYTDVNCSMDWYSSLNTCAIIWADVNGKKGPNQFGRDFFSFALKNDGLYPTGGDKTSHDCNNTTQAGYNCSLRIINEGEMNY